MHPIIKIVSTLVIAALACVVSVFFLKKGYKNYAVHGTHRLTELLVNKIYFDIVYIGSSRTHTSIHPQIVDSILHCNSYNAGVEGGNLLEFNMMLEAYLQNHPSPKMLVLTLDLYSFNLDRPFFNYTQYLNFINNKVIDKTLNTNGHNTLLYKYLPFITITDFDDFSRGNAIKGLLRKGGIDMPAGENEYKGYLSNTNKGIDTFKPKPLSKINQKISDTAITYLQNIITICKNKNIKLVVTYAPEYNFGLQASTLNAAEIFNVINSKLQSYAIPYFRHDSLDICNNSNLFANIGHLNTPGSIVYSKILANQLIPLY